MKLTIENQMVGLADLRAAWLSPTTVDLGDDARRRIAESNELIAELVAGGEQVYGVNTGFGQLAQVRISDDELAHLQENLVRSHAVGVGKDLDDDIVRLVMLMKVIALAEGFSGVRLELVEALQHFAADRLNQVRIGLVGAHLGPGAQAHEGAQLGLEAHHQRVQGCAVARTSRLGQGLDLGCRVVVLHADRASWRPSRIAPPVTRAGGPWAGGTVWREKSGNGRAAAALGLVTPGESLSGQTRSPP